MLFAVFIERVCLYITIISWWWLKQSRNISEKVQCQIRRCFVLPNKYFTCFRL